MYNIELQRITLENAQNEALKAVENLCDSFHLENQFGILSSAATNLISLIERCTENQYEEFNLNFFIESEKVSMQITHFQYIKEVMSCIENATLEDADNTAFVFRCLTDNVELRSNGNELWADIDVRPQFDSIDRAEILQKEKTETLQHKNL